MEKNGRILVGEGAYLHIVRVYGLFCYPRAKVPTLAFGGLAGKTSFGLKFRSDKLSRNSRGRSRVLNGQLDPCVGESHLPSYINRGLRLTVCLASKSIGAFRRQLLAIALCRQRASNSLSKPE